MTRRKWRAVASYRLAPGIRPVVVGRCYRATRPGLDRFIAEHEAAGCTVLVWEVRPIPGVDEVTACPICDEHGWTACGVDHRTAATAGSPPVPSVP